jgi:hypothetical protein
LAVLVRGWQIRSVRPIGAVIRHVGALERHGRFASNTCELYRPAIHTPA